MWSLLYRNGAHGPALQPAQALMLLLTACGVTHGGPVCGPWTLCSCSAIPRVLPGLWGTQCVGAMRLPQQQEFLPLGDIGKCLQGPAACPARPACLEGPWLILPWVSLSCPPSHSQSSEGPSSRHHGQEHQPSLSAGTCLWLPARNALQCLFHLSMYLLLYSRSYLINVKSSFLKTILLMALAPTVYLAGGTSVYPGGPRVYFQLSGVLREDDINIAEDDIANYYCSLTFLNC